MTSRKDCKDSTSKQFRRISSAAFREAWLDRSRLLSELSAEFGLSERALRERAKGMGLPVREPLGRELIIKGAREDLFIYLFRLGVGGADLARFFKVSLRSVANTRDRLGLEPRRVGWRPTITIAQLMEAQMARSMAKTARIEQAAMINAEMADWNHNKAQVGARHARGAT